VTIQHYTPPTDNVDVVTSASIFTPMNGTVDYLNAHMAGQGTPGGPVTNHDDTMINVGVALAEVAANQVQNPATQRIYNDGTWGALSKLIGTGYGSLFMTKVANIGTDTWTWLASTLKSHNHADATHGGQLAQANTHLTPDTDSAPTALHHTLGSTANQAAAGNHVHSGPQAYAGLAAPSTAALILHNAPGDPNQTIIAVQNNAGTTTLWGITPTGVGATIPITSTGVDGATGANFVGKASGVVNGAITTAMLAANSVSAGNIQDASITGGPAGTGVKIAANTITTENIKDATILGADIANDTITATQIAANAVTASELADASVDTAAIQDSAVTASKLDTTARALFSAVGHVHTDGDPSLPGSEQPINGAHGILARSVTSDRLQEGAVLSQKSNGQAADNLTVHVNPLRKWDGTTYIYWPGGDSGTTQLSGLIPPAADHTWCYILVAINSTPQIVCKAGAAVMGGLNNAAYPSADPGTTPVGFIGAYSGMTVITQGDITGARAILYNASSGGSGGSGGPFAPVNHVHGQSGASFVAGWSLDDGRVWATSPTPSLSVNIQPFTYRGSNGITQNNGQAALTWGGAGNPPLPTGVQQRIDLIYFDIAQQQLGVAQGAPDIAQNPQKPALTSTQVSLAYLHLFANMTQILDSNNGTGQGYIENARTQMAMAGLTPTSGGTLGVVQGGTGSSGFAQGLIFQGDPNTQTTPLTSIPADGSPSGTATNTYGLSLKPVVNVTSAGATVDVERVGGGTINNAANVVTTAYGLHVIQPAAKGSGNITSVVGLLVDTPAMGQTNNVSAIFRGNVGIGMAAGNLPASGNMLDVTGAVHASGAVVFDSTAQISKLGVGMPPAANTIFAVGGTFAASTPVGIGSQGTLVPQGGTSAYGIYSSPLIDTTPGSVPNAYGIYAGPMSHPAGAANILMAYGVYAQQPGIGTNGNYAGYFAGQFATTGSTAFPAVAAVGEAFYRNDLRSWWMYGSSGFRSMGSGMFTAAEGFPTSAAQGARAYIFDWHSEFMYDGSGWSQMSVPFINGTLPNSPAPPIGTRYINGGDGKTYRWNGSAWVPMGRQLLSSVAGGGDLWAGAVTGANTYNAFNTISITVTDPTSIIEVQQTQGFTLNNGGAVNNLSVCLQMDSGARYFVGATDSVPANAGGVATPSGGTVTIPNPGVGTHTITAQLFTQASCTLFGRFGSAPNIEFCRTTAWETHLS
jgi:hypothetical protein